LVGVHGCIAGYGKLSTGIDLLIKVGYACLDLYVGPQFCFPLGCRSSEALINLEGRVLVSECRLSVDGADGKFNLYAILGEYWGDWASLYG